jgi:hypothetical protein
MNSIEGPGNGRGHRLRMEELAMDTLDRSFQCDVVSALEERIWLDRREAGHPWPSRSVAGVGRLAQWLRDLRARMQLGPFEGENDWSGGDPEKRF